MKPGDTMESIANTAALALERLCFAVHDEAFELLTCEERVRATSKPIRFSTYFDLRTLKRHEPEMVARFVIATVDTLVSPRHWPGPSRLFEAYLDAIAPVRIGDHLRATLLDALSRRLKRERAAG